MGRFIQGQSWILARSQPLELCCIAQSLQFSDIPGLPVAAFPHNSWPQHCVWHCNAGIVIESAKILPEL